MVNPFGNIYYGKRVLVTGHTGFKGGWLSLWLQALGAEISGLSLPPTDRANLFEILPPTTFKHSWLCDLRDFKTLKEAVRACRPNIIFHLAAQPIVGASYREPVETLSTNALGTALLLEAVRAEQCAAAVVVVTSDKCYLNHNSDRPFVEGDPLGGHDIYSMSKAAAELVVAAWSSSFFANDSSLGPLATARAGNVIGGGDYAEDRILPDAVRAFINQEPLVLRRPLATRPWQHVLEPLSGYLALGHRMLSTPGDKSLLNLNFGPELDREHTVRELLEHWLEEWPDAFTIEACNLPQYGEAARLRLDITQSKRTLGWSPVWDFGQTVAKTVLWYRARHQARASDSEILALTRKQIADYTIDAARLRVSWAA